MSVNADTQYSIVKRSFNSTLIIDTNLKAKQKIRIASTFVFPKITQHTLP